MTGRWRESGRVAALAALALLAGCAPRPSVLAPVTAGARADLYVAQLTRREERAARVEGEVMLRSMKDRSGDSTASRWPTVQAAYFVGWPEAFRLRVGSLFGTALDLALAGDSVTAYVPAGRWGVALDATRDSLGLERPGRALARLWCAGWRPPRAAWADGTWDGDGLAVGWRDGEDSVTIVVDRDGLPTRASETRGGGRGVDVRYERWETVEGVAWPVALRVVTRDGALDLACRVDRVTFPRGGDGSRLAVRIPGGAERIGVADLRDLLERAGVWR
jgi:hypothetical protein